MRRDAWKSLISTKASTAIALANKVTTATKVVKYRIGSMQSLRSRQPVCQPDADTALHPRLVSRLTYVREPKLATAPLVGCWRYPCTQSFAQGFPAGRYFAPRSFSALAFCSGVTPLTTATTFLWVLAGSEY